MISVLQRMRARVRRVPGIRRIPGAVRRASRVGAALRWRLRIGRYLTFPVRFDLLSGRIRPDALLVVVCLWHRPERIQAIVQALADQCDCPPIRLVLWNNNAADDAHYRAVGSAYAPSGPLASIELHSSAENIGGIARFITARQLLRTGHTPFVMIDDDQDPGRHFVRDALAQYTANSFAGVWAFHLEAGYWDRYELSHGDTASYVGTGGSVCDSALVRSRRFFAGLPYRYGFIEDLWASAYFSSHSVALRKLNTPVTFAASETDQHHQLVWHKAEFFEYLQVRFAPWPGRTPEHD